MPSLANIKTVWENLSEMDLAPLREEALRGIHLTIIGTGGSGRSTLASQMRRDPNHTQMVSQTPVSILDLAEVEKISASDLVILIVELDKLRTNERHVADTLINNGIQTLVFVNQTRETSEGLDLVEWTGWDPSKIVHGNVGDEATLLEAFVPVVMANLPEHLTALARAFPLFRVPVANRMINDTCLSNAAYSLSTGLAEMVPVLGIPLTIADIFVLTKMQAFLVYKLGLALGLSTRWQDYIAEFGGVLGGGFLWRQIARSLVGLIPLYGIVPKVAIAYAGTYVVGHVVLRWYLTGRHISKQEMNALFKQAIIRGRLAATRLLAKKPKGEKKPRRFKLPGRRKSDPD